MAMAVLPVLRSPMMSSRWPRPTGVIASMALMPVCSGCVTGCRAATPGAMNSTARVLLVTIGPFAVERNAQRIDDAADDGIADRHAQQLAGGADFVAFGDFQVFAENDDARPSFLRG